MATMHPFISSSAMVFLWFFTIAANINFCRGNSNVVCINSEREALLQFKHDLIDPSDRLSSWFGNEDCCQWAGVVCNKSTGHVEELHLQNPYVGGQSYVEVKAYALSTLGGKISPSLQNLKDLKHLDLSYNDFEGIIPYQLGNLSNMQYLSLGGYYYKSLYATNLHWLSGLTMLQHLKLSNVKLSQASDWFQVTNILPSLMELSLSGCELDHFPPLPTVNFTHLVSLDLSKNHHLTPPTWLFSSFIGLDSLNLAGCNFQGPIPNGLQNMTHLRYLDLSDNNFNSTIPESLYGFNHLEYLNLAHNNFHGLLSTKIGNLSSLTALNLTYNELEGRLPRSFENLCNLRVIELSGFNFHADIKEVLDIMSRCIIDKLEFLVLINCKLFGHLPPAIDILGQSDNLNVLFLASNSISGPIPMSLCKFSSLTDLDLSGNELTGTIPWCLGELVRLEYLDISQNALDGVVSEAILSNLTGLEAFVASGNHLTLKVSPNWVPPSRLNVLFLNSWFLGSQFPSWLHSPNNFTVLDLSSTGISDTIPSWFWDFSGHLVYLNLSNNRIHGEIANIENLDGGSIIDLSSNQFKGPLPLLFSDAVELYLSNNFFVGPISYFLCHRKDELKNLRVLNLEANMLSGEIPDCWFNWQGLKFVNLGGNNLSGKIPMSMGFLTSLESLHLHKNRLMGGLPGSLQNCKKLITINLGENTFSGRIPIWIGERLSNLKILIFRSNEFTGHIPTEFCALTSIHILDLAHNSLSGAIPRCLNNITAMINTDRSRVQQKITYITYNEIIFNNDFLHVNYFLEHATVVMKGRVVDYNTILLLVSLLDFSDNKLSGEIPEQLTSLSQLQSLNLSYNLLIGKIPDSIGLMGSLQSLDFSTNQLSGEIPPRMSNLTFLSQMNLSCNNLTGKIPSSTQFQTFHASSFIGNELCGPPLSKSRNVTSIIEASQTVVPKCLKLGSCHNYNKPATVDESEKIAADDPGVQM